MAIKVGINGFGRIGRLFFRAAMRQGGIEIVGINDLVEADNLAYLLQRDTMHGRFEKKVSVESDGLTCDGVHTRCTSERDPSNLPWADLGVDTFWNRPASSPRRMMPRSIFQPAPRGC